MARLAIGSGSAESIHEKAGVKARSPDHIGDAERAAVGPERPAPRMPATRSTRSTPALIRSRGLSGPASRRRAGPLAAPCGPFSWRREDPVERDAQYQPHEHGGEPRGRRSETGHGPRWGRPARSDAVAASSAISAPALLISRSCEENLPLADRAQCLSDAPP
jgi:hypothetical protein